MSYRNNHEMRTRWLWVTLIAPWLIAVMWAQAVTNARLNGIVTDSSGASAPNAKVRLVSSETGVTREFTTNEMGGYVFALVPPGRYELQVEKEGFNRYQQPGIVLAVGQVSTMNVKLQVGAVSEVVEVAAAAPVLNTGNANIGSEVSGTQVVQLPLNIRNVFGLAFLDSSVNNFAQTQVLSAGTRASSDHDIAFLNFGGGRMGTTAYLVDGHWNSAGDWDAVIFVPTVDELQEFKIEKNTFSPQYGWSSGNAVNAVTKSGTSDIHGSVYEFLRNDNLDANNFFNNRNNLEKANFSRHQFGFTAGGPLYIPKVYEQRNKTFFFGAYEGLRESLPSTFLITVPTDLEKAGDFSRSFNQDGSLKTIYDPLTTKSASEGYSRTAFAGNVIPPTRMDAVAKNLLQYWPSANRPGAPITSDQNYVGTVPLPSTFDQFSARLDHNISDNQRIFGRYSYKWQMKTETAPLYGADNPGSPGSTRPNNKLDFGLGYSHAFGPTLVLSSTFGFGRWVEGLDPLGAGFTPSTVGLPSLLDNIGGTTGFPSISVDGISGLGSGAIDRSPRDNRSFAVDLTKVLGAHTFTFGFNFIDLQYRNSVANVPSFSFGRSFTRGPDPLTQVQTSGTGFADFLLGTGSGSVSNNARSAIDKKYIAAYFGDEWRVRPNVTVNLGLRWDVQTAPTERFDRFAYIDPNLANPLSQQVGLTLSGGYLYTGSGNPRGVYDAPYTNFSPRISFAYRPLETLVIRSGAGIFFIPSMEFGSYQGLGLTGYSQSTSMVGTEDGFHPVNTLSNPYPSGLLLPTGRALGALTNVGADLSGPERARPTPYFENWTFGLQKQIASDIVVQADYVGNHGIKLPESPFNYNQLPTEYLSLGSALFDQVDNPFYGNPNMTPGSLTGETVSRAQLLRPYPQFTSVSSSQHVGASSWYHALMLSANKRFNNGLLFLVSYTWSKHLSTNEGQDGWMSGGPTQLNFYDRSLEKSVATGDLPHRLVVSYVYELPVGKGKALAPSNKVVNAVAGGWQVSGIHSFNSGLPLAFSAPNNTYASGNPGQRPNIIGNPQLDNPTIDRWFDTSVFVQPANYTFGTAPRLASFVRSDGLNNTDLLAAKGFELYDRLRMQFRAEFFNCFNQANFYRPNTSFTSSSFGRVSSAYPARTIQFGLKMNW